MQFLTSLKYNNQRTYLSAAALINILELSLLGTVIVDILHPFFQSIFGLIIPEKEPSETIVLLLAAIVLIFIASSVVSATFQFLRSQILWNFASIFLKMYTYIFLIPLLSLNILYIKNSQSSLITTVAAVFNILSGMFLASMHEFLNWSYKFKEEDYCNRRLTSQLEGGFGIAAVVFFWSFGSFYASAILIVRAMVILTRLYSNFEYSLIQRCGLFYGFFTIFCCTVVLFINFGLVEEKSLKQFIPSVFMLSLGAVTSYLLSQTLSAKIINNIIQSLPSGFEKLESENQVEVIAENSYQIENQIKILVQVIVQKELKDRNQPNKYQLFWKIFNQRVYVHKLKCQESKCICKNKGKTDDDIYINDLLKKSDEASKQFSKQSKIKVLYIYLLIEIAKKPLKGFFELMILKKEKNTLPIKMQLEDLTGKTRQCFDQIFMKNKVKNQQLQLMKVIDFEEKLNETEDDLKSAITKTINFLELFTFSSIKLSSIENESFKLFELKEKISNRIEEIVKQSSDSPAITMLLYIYYKYLEVYRSKQIEIKKAMNQQLIKKRLYQKSEVDIFNSENGIIFIDLVQERGKIKKITKNISQFFGYSPEDMISFNINMFMPRMFGKYHARFLSNFIDKGRIKLLIQKARFVFGKNKKKFLFPLQISLKAEHLLEGNFGASALITPVQTSSQFMLGGNFGRLEEVTENIFKKIFGNVYKDQPMKINKFCLYKLIPSLNTQIENFDEKNINKIFDGLLIFSDNEQYLYEKFRYTRNTEKVVASNSKSTLSISSTASSADGNLISLNQKVDYFSELFRSFLSDIDIFKLRAIRISYKYSKVRTNQFELDLVELITVKQEEVVGKQLYRQILSQLMNLGEIYQLLTNHSPLSVHLEQLEQALEKEEFETNKNLTKKTMVRMKSFQRQNKTRVIIQNRQRQSLIDRFSEDVFLSDEDNKLVNNNVQNSETSSVIGSSENESKKQILINAFNSQQSVLSTNSLTVINVIIVFLVILLCVTSFMSYKLASTTTSLWKDSKFIVDFRQIYQFRTALVELEKLYKNLNISEPAYVNEQIITLNGKMKFLVQSISYNTQTSQNFGGVYSTVIELLDSNKNRTQEMTVPQLLNKLLFLYEKMRTRNSQLLQQNYEALHIQLSNFYNKKTESNLQKSEDIMSVIKYMFITYQIILAFIAILALPFYAYFKEEEKVVKSKLSHMSIKEIRKSICKLKMIQDHIKLTDHKHNISNLQIEMAQKFKEEREDENVGVNRTIKITSEHLDKTILKSPIVYFLLLLFIAFFSNLSITLFSTSTNNCTFFKQVIKSNILARELEIKSALLINTHITNLNRALSNTTAVNFSSKILREYEQGFFQLLDTLAKRQYRSNFIGEQINRDFSKIICGQVDCSSLSVPLGSYGGINLDYSPTTNVSLVYITLMLRNKLSYWMPKNQPNSTVQAFVEEAQIINYLQYFKPILQLSLIINEEISNAFEEKQGHLQLILIILAVILIPLNVFLLFLFEYKFVQILNSILKNAEHIYMHFDVSVLIENTYLTSYFNSKLKSAK